MQLRFFSKEHKNPGCSLHVWNNSRSWSLVWKTHCHQSSYHLARWWPTEVHQELYEETNRMKGISLDLRDTPASHKNSDAMLYMDGNIFIKCGTRYTGLQQLLKVKWFGPKTYIPNAWWKRRPVIAYHKSLCFRYCTGECYDLQGRRAHHF